MDHVLRLFVGMPDALQPFLALVPDVRLYALTRHGTLAVLPFDDALQDALHRRFGTGQWPAGQRLLLSTTDQSFAADCSARAPLGYVEMLTDDVADLQSAAVWQHGRLTLGPTTLDLRGTGAGRPKSLWPVNVALRTLGISAATAGDELSVFGLADYFANADIHAHGWPLGA